MRKLLLTFGMLLALAGAAQASQVCFKWGWATNNYDGNAPIVTCDATAESFKYVKNSDVTLSWNTKATISNSYITVPGNWDVTVTPQAGLKVTEVKFGCYSAGNASSMANNFTGTNGTVKADGLAAVWTGESTEADPATISFGYCTSYVLYILVTYEESAGAATKMPVCSLASGDYTPGQTIELTAQEGAVISYSLTNSETAESWQTYTEPLQLNEEGTFYLRAKATLNDVESKIFEAVYNISKTVRSSFVINSSASSKYTGVFQTYTPPTGAFLPANGSMECGELADVSWTGEGLQWRNTTAAAWLKAMGNGTITISPKAGVTINKVTFFNYSGYGTNCQYVTVDGQALTLNGNNGSWTGSATTPLTFTLQEGKSLEYINYIQVDYAYDEPTGVVVEVPVITPEAGTYKVGQLVTITAAEGDQIQYSATTDGSDEWKDYSAPFALADAGTWTVKARALQGADMSEETQAVYTVEYLDVAAPVISPADGAYAPGQLVTITAEEGATIKYTASLDAAEEWKDYTEPFALNDAGTWTVKAQAFVGVSPSAVASATYTLAKGVAPISFDLTHAEATLTREFESPVLQNPQGVEVSYSSTDTSVATVDAVGNVALVGAGETEIVASFAGNDKYEAGTASYTLTVFKANPELSFATNKASAIYGQTFQDPQINNPQNVDLVWNSTNEEVATVDASGMVTIVGWGRTEISALSVDTDIYNAVSASYTLTVFNPNAPVTEESATIVVQDYYYTNQYVYEPVVQAVSTAPYTWNNFDFLFGPTTAAAELRSNYQSMMGTGAKAASVQLNANGNLTLTAPAGATMTKVVFHLFDANQLGKVTASNGEVAAQAKFDTAVTWTGSADSVTFTVSPKATYGVDLSAAGVMLFTSVAIDYNQMEFQLGVENIEALDRDVEIYTLNGIRVRNSRPAPGLYIIKQGNKARKVLINS